MTEKQLLEIRKRDFLAKDNNYAVIKGVKSVLRYGKHAKKAPLITVIMPTYKRTDLLGRAISSVLNQTGFDDFQLLIVDNEPVLDRITDTEKIIREFNSDKIIYYKNTENVGMYGNWNRCIELARSEWVCMIHDDDLLVKNHLSVMSGILKKHPKIDFLSCRMNYLDGRKEAHIDLEEATKEVTIEEAVCKKRKYFDYNFRFITYFLGSVFRRKCALDIGGFQANSTLIEDYIFVSKFSYYYNAYECNLPLYRYYFGANESLNLKIWEDQSVYEYYLYRYISKQRPKLLQPLYLLRSKSRGIELVRELNDGTSFLKEKCDIKESQFRKQCEIGTLHYNWFNGFLLHVIVYISASISKCMRKQIKVAV